MVSLSEKLLYTALDFNEKKTNLTLAERLAREAGNFGFKLNLDHVVLWGIDYVHSILEQGKPVFVDLKMHNGTRTMGHILSTLAEMGVSDTNVWAEAGEQIVEAKRMIEGSRMRLLGVTVTTRYDDDYCQENFGRSMKDSVRHFAQMAISNGCDGIILPGTCLDAVRDLDTVKLVPAIRPEGYPGRADQEQPVTPYEAVINGADILVCGSPIYKAADPVQALHDTLSQMRVSPTA